MAVSLNKGGNVSLAKLDASLEKVLVGLSWEPNQTLSKYAYDLDSSVFMVGKNGKVAKDEDFIFYNNLVSACGSVKHEGDNRTGDAEGYDERVLIDLKKVPSHVERLIFTVTIHNAAEYRQNFGQVREAKIDILNAVGEVKLAGYDLSEDSSTETAMIFGEVYRYNGEWKFKAVGQGYEGGLAALARSFGVNIS